MQYEMLPASEKFDYFFGDCLWGDKNYKYLLMFIIVSLRFIEESERERERGRGEERKRKKEKKIRRMKYMQRKRN